MGLGNFAVQWNEGVARFEIAQRLLNSTGFTYPGELWGRGLAYL